MSCGKDFSEEEIQEVWEKATIINTKHKNLWRNDLAGAVIRREDYGDQNSLYGWEIDHIRPCNPRDPKVTPGTDEMSNLQPLQWENNKRKSGYYPKYSTLVSASRTGNIFNEKRWHILKNIPKVSNP